MNGLKVQDFHGQQVIDSRDVADMISRNHKELLRTIKTYIEYLAEGENPVGAQRKIAPSDFFIPSTYLNAQNKEMPNYLITKKGCDMVANKLTGKKGVLFTAAYVTAFEEMRKELEAPKQSRLSDGVSLSGLASLVRITRRVMLDIGSTPTDVGVMVKEMFEAVNFPVPSTLSKQLPGQMDLFNRAGLEAAQG